MTDKPEAAAPGPAALQPTPEMLLAMLEQKKLQALAQRALLDDVIRDTESRIMGVRSVIDALKPARPEGAA